jgi:hypothetical protein
MHRPCAFSYFPHSPPGRRLHSNFRFPET